jgi:hypothetical protein
MEILVRRITITVKAKSAAVEDRLARVVNNFLGDSVETLAEDVEKTLKQPEGSVECDVKLHDRLKPRPKSPPKAKTKESKPLPLDRLMMAE